MVDSREIFIKRLEEDLIGPFSGENEILFSKPSNHYLTGIIYPKKTHIPDAEQDDTEEVFKGKDIGDAAAETGVSGFRRFKPCTAGVSFAVKSHHENASIILQIQFGRYMPEPTFIPFDLSGDNNPKPYPAVYWKRAQYNKELHITLGDDINRISLDEPGLESIEVFVRKKRLSDCSIVTVQVINTFEPTDTDDKHAVEENSMFQFFFTIKASDGTVFHPRKTSTNESDEDNRISNLIFCDVHEFATGHNCSVKWDCDEKGSCSEIVSTWMPREEVKSISHSGDFVFQEKIAKTSVGRLSAQAMFESPKNLLELSAAVSNAYATWINEQTERISTLDKQFVKQAKTNLERCKSASLRIKEGITYLEEHPDAMKAFQLANLVMRIQRSWVSGKSDWRKPDDTDLIWRPFQLAFALMCLPSSSERGHKDRNIFDLIWFPTGGGKTEAYLLLSAYVLFLRRIKNENISAIGLSVIMRYTLRTLTIQQFERAAAMITACEVIRVEEYSDLLGSERFSIGLWVGSASTPNKLTDAYKALNEDANPTSTPAQIKTCPRCHGTKNSLRWHSSAPNQKVSVSCSNESCANQYPFNDLPFLTVDDQIYDEVPSLLIGTVDKFAQITRNKNCGKLFGVNSDRLPPDLIIQDELHLISGPLGSLTGIYELAIDELCKTDYGPTKIIGSTATIRRAEEQVRALFDRDAFQFPPAAIDSNNNGFAKADFETQGRLYLGISSAGRSPKFSLQAIAASLLQTGKSDEISETKRKYYETLVSYYNSLRELGGALIVMQDDVPDTINVIANRRSEMPRRLSIPGELTSRIPSSEIPNILKSLALESSEDGLIDVLLASNMLSVGVDIPKLGLMLVHGQPKSMSEYIQATSRVGRTSDGPGLVITLYNDSKIRDRAHFETFKTWHSSLYRSVEATSITPFASRARDKALHAPLVALVRHKLGISNVKLKNDDKQRIIDEVLPIIEARISRIDSREAKPAMNELIEFLDYWEERSELKSFWNDRRPASSLLISAEMAASRRASGKKSFDAKPTPNSVRNVEPSTLFKIREYVSLPQSEEQDV